MENFDEVIKTRINSRGEKKPDPSIYLGTGGITLTLQLLSCLPGPILDQVVPAIN